MSEITRSFDETVLRNEIRRMKGHIESYELIKANNHPVFSSLKEFYLSIAMCRQNFLKVYNRFKNGGSDERLLLPQQRGPKYRTRRPDIEIEQAVIRERAKGLNKYEIFEIMKKKYKDLAPSPSGNYKIFRRYKMNKLSTEMKIEKKRYVREKVGDLAHTDCYDLPQGLVENYSNKLYLVGLLDDCSRSGWCEVIENKKSITVMFGLMRNFTALLTRYLIEFKECLNDNGSENGAKKNKDGNTDNPVQLLYQELGIKQRYTRPYRPQTNGKMERFWRTLKEDFLEGSIFSSVDELKKELRAYLVYYNEYRPHQGINGKKPLDIVKEQSDKNDDN